MANGDEAEIQKASEMLETARKSGRIVTAKQMTPAAQTAQKRLLAKQQPQKTTGAFDAAESELARRKSGVGGKYMVK